MKLKAAIILLGNLARNEYIGMLITIVVGWRAAQNNRGVWPPSNIIDFSLTPRFQSWHMQFALYNVRRGRAYAMSKFGRDAGWHTKMTRHRMAQRTARRSSVDIVKAWPLRR